MTWQKCAQEWCPVANAFIAYGCSDDGHCASPLTGLTWFLIMVGCLLLLTAIVSCCFCCCRRHQANQHVTVVSSANTTTSESSNLLAPWRNDDV